MESQLDESCVLSSRCHDVMLQRPPENVLQANLLGKLSHALLLLIS